MREGEVEFGIERHDLAAELLENLRREGARRAVAAGRDDLQLALELRAVGEIGDIARRKIGHIAIAAAVGVAIGAGEHDLVQPAHFVRAEGDGPLRAHFHAGPAIVVMRGGDHRDGRHIEIELREIGHRRQAPGRCHAL